jgi:hypothetical protein
MTAVNIPRPVTAIRSVRPIGAEHQSLRRDDALRRHREAAFDRYLDDGRMRTDKPHDWRTYFWNAASFLQGEPRHVRRANAMLRHVAPLGGGHFWTSAATVILARYGRDQNLLDPDVTASLTARLAEQLPREADHWFRGYNDNYPAMAALSTLVGSYLTGQPHLVPGGLRNLDSLRKLYMRRGFLSEYASPTYSPITLSMLAEIVSLSPNAEARELALVGEQRLWGELASRWHAPTSSLAGPHSRAYMADMCAHHHTAHVIFYIAMGEAVCPINLTNAQYPAVPGQAFHNGGPSVGKHACVEYHPPEWAYDLALSKKRTYTVRASAEVAAMSRNCWSTERHPETPHVEAPAHDDHTTCHMTPDFAIGTSRTSWLDGPQHAGMHVVYRRRTAIESLRDVGSIFPRYLFNEPVFNRHQHIDCQGRTVCVQHASTAMVAYRPRPVYGKERNVGYDVERSPVTAAKLSLVVPSFWNPPVELFIGETRATGWEGESEQPQSIYLHDGRIFVAIHPLHVTDLGRGCGVRLEQSEGFGLISFVNYQGTGRTFAAHELPAIRNGFVIEVVSVDAFDDFSAFRAAHASPRIEDSFDASDGMRRIRYERPGLSLGMEISPYSDGIKCRTVNDRLADEPRFEATGFDPSAMPWW